MFYGVLYFAGPRSRWAERVDESEIIARTAEVPWRWLARRALLSLFRQMDSTRVGFALMHGDRCVEQYDPPLEGA